MQALIERGKAIGGMAKEMGPRAEAMYATIGERMRKMPPSYRIGIGLALGGVAIAGGAGALAIPALAWRAAGGAGTYALTKELLKKSYERAEAKGVVISERRKKLATAG